MTCLNRIYKTTFTVQNNIHKTTHTPALNQNGVGVSTAEHRRFSIYIKDHALCQPSPKVVTPTLRMNPKKLVQF